MVGHKNNNNNQQQPKQTANQPTNQLITFAAAMPHLPAIVNIVKKGVPLLGNKAPATARVAGCIHQQRRDALGVSAA